ncbi:CoA transferase [Ktedonobacter sp. SOSP1-85]|uniref:CaiB/BaiF CoA transferase family protein n=1 Tax=Ktedonobacter sp. SOSP1-85 TaxID=2778367 RepID=UPI001915BCE2|nr:CoA transferase [Ktedonobacter sp. SOSP1-85]GHO80223.1 CoA transferase [Ktedonobacter sp. SOSP1-85]
MNAVLSDIIVVDLSHVLAGPYCTMMLGDLGATVVKVERPGQGDDTRGFGPPSAGGESAYFLGLNRNKMSVTLDFNEPEEKQQLLELLRQATVVVENFRPGSLAKKGLGYEDVKHLNPGLIYCSISGYGQDGPRAAQPGYDLVAQAESGLMAITGAIDGEPTLVGSPITDIMAGVLACLSILAALRVRDQTGQGQHIDISLQEAAISLLGNVASNYLVSGEEAERYGNAHPNIVPYQSFATRDGHIVVACGNDHLFHLLCQVLAQEELATDPRFTTNAQRVLHREELIPALQKLFLQRTTQDWLDDLHRAGIPSGSIRSISDVFHDPQLAHRGFIWECPHPTAGCIRLLGSPLRLEATPPRLYNAPPRLGEDNNLCSLRQTVETR